MTLRRTAGAGALTAAVLVGSAMVGVGGHGVTTAHAAGAMFYYPGTTQDSDLVAVPLCVGSPVALPVPVGLPTCTLREAIKDANANSGSTVVLQASTTYILDAALGQLVVSTDMTIQGAGSASSEISGTPGSDNFNDRVLDIVSPVGDPGVSITGVAVTHGEKVGYGGGIRHHGGRLMLSDVRVAHNVARTGDSSSTAAGGGIANVGGALVADHLAVDDNSLASDSDFSDLRVGGGIFNGATGAEATSMTLTNSTVTGGSAGAGSKANAMSGGGIFNMNALTLTDVTISGNGAENEGGGLYNASNETNTITRLKVTGNHADGTALLADIGGGGIYDETGNFDACRLALNITRAIAPSTSGTTAYTDVLVSGNTAKANGGGVYVSSVGSAVVTFTRTLITANTAGRLGGGWYSGSTTLGPVVSNTTIAANGAGISGGGVAMGGPKPTYLTLLNDTISGNTADPALLPLTPLARVRNLSWVTATGGLYTGTGDHLTITNTIVSGNTMTPQAAARTAARAIATTGRNCADGGAQLTGGGVNLYETDECQHVATDLIADPALQPLADNGGFTRTEAIRATSPAHDVAAANSVCPTTDQRGPGVVPARITTLDPNCDLGAYELLAQAPATPAPTPTPTAGSQGVAVLTPATGAGVSGSSVLAAALGILGVGLLLAVPLARRPRRD